MDDSGKQQLWGAVTALQHLCAATWEVLLMESDNPLRDLATARERMLAEFEPGLIRGVSDDATFAVSQHGLAFLESFWTRMEDQVRHQLK